MKLNTAPLAPGLYFVATPIGSARDITLRALDILASADVIAAEDTRTARKLMDIHGVALGDRRVVAYHDHSGPGVRDRLVRSITEGRSVAYVSEAGTPLVSDPGYGLAQGAIAAGLPVLAAPGASAVLAALAVAGLPTDRFAFLGFLPSTQTARQAALSEISGMAMTVVLYESPKRLAAMLGDVAQVMGADRPVVVCRELTKKFEDVRRGGAAELADWAQEGVRGEIVVLIGGAEAEAASEEDVEAALRSALESHKIKDAAALVAGAYGLPRREVYQRALKLRGD